MGNYKKIEMSGIKDKRILFFAPAFFGYELKIKAKMEEMGAVVDFYDERSVKKAASRALLKISSDIFEYKSKRYYSNIIEKHKNQTYDYIFVVKCDMMTESILQDLHIAFPKAMFCLYLWDSVKNIKGVTDKFKYFDRVLTFDRQDAVKYPVMKFRPLFYADEFRLELNKDNDYKYDISFCGTIHSDRYKIIRKIIDYCRQYKLKYFTFCYLQSKFIYHFYKITKPEFSKTKESDFSFAKMSSRNISDVVKKSRVILDVQHPNQMGLTMRTIEMLGMNKKLITTNPEIKKYDFYNPNNILVVDRKNIQIPHTFFKSKYTALSDDIFEKYSIESWIKDILVNI